MKSPLPETEPQDLKEEKNEESKVGKKSSLKSQKQPESEKDSGFSDSSSESLSSEETNGSTTVNAPGATQGTTTVQTSCTPIYILQNVILKQVFLFLAQLLKEERLSAFTQIMATLSLFRCMQKEREAFVYKTQLLLLQPPGRRHRKRPFPSSYLPILRSYPKIAPRLAPLPSPSPAPSCSTPPMNRTASSHLLEISLRSLALLRRTRESQRSIRELRTHARLFEQALQGEEGGWERLQKVMEQSGGYRRVNSSSVSDMVLETAPSIATLTEPDTPLDVTMTSLGDAETHNEESMISEKSMISLEVKASECKEGNL